MRLLLVILFLYFNCNSSVAQSSINCCDRLTSKIFAQHFYYQENIYKQFKINLREYKQPTCCGMVLCRGCKYTQSPCSPFNPKIVFYSVYFGCLNGTAPCKAISISDFKIINSCSNNLDNY